MRISDLEFRRVLVRSIDRLVADMPLDRGRRISILVNSLGATPPEELYIMFSRARSRFADMGVDIVMPLVGRYATSMEMTGATLTVIALDDELERLLKEIGRASGRERVGQYV